jgi:hypothetical protein
MGLDDVLEQKEVSLVRVPDTRRIKRTVVDKHLKHRHNQYEEHVVGWGREVDPCVEFAEHRKGTVASGRVSGLRGPSFRIKNTSKPKRTYLQGEGGLRTAEPGVRELHLRSTPLEYSHRPG